jgi:hypothetical protein
LTVQERHYIEENAHLRQAERDNGGLGTLSAHGQAVLRRFARYAGEMAEGGNRRG